MRTFLLATAIPLATLAHAQTFMRAYTLPGASFDPPQAYLVASGVIPFDDGYMIATLDGRAVGTDLDGAVTVTVDLRNADGSHSNSQLIRAVERIGSDILALVGKGADTTVVMRVGTNAVVQWQRATVFTGAASQEGIMPLPDGGCMLRHNRSQGLNSRPVLTRFAANGNATWQRTYRAGSTTVGSLFIRGMAPLADGGLIVTGAYNPTSPMRPVVAKLAADGTPDWVREIASQNNGNEIGLTAIELANGDIRVAVGDVQIGARLATVDLSSTGTLIAARAYGGLPASPGVVRFQPDGSLSGACSNNGTAFRIAADGTPVFGIAYAALPGSAMVSEDFRITPDGGHLFLGNYTYTGFSDFTPVLYKTGTLGQAPAPFSTNVPLSLQAYAPVLSTGSLADSVVSSFHTTTLQFVVDPLFTDTLFGVPTAIRELPAANEALMLWPNPITDHITLEHAEGIRQVFITDATGRLVHEASVNVSPVRIGTTGMWPGMHHATVVTQLGRRSTAAFIVGDPHR